MAVDHSEQSGTFVTNHLNLMFSLASGMILPPSGFGNKYYTDTLNEQPGWIPVFLEKIPHNAIALSIQEAKYLLPVMIRINLLGLDLSYSNSNEIISYQLHLFESNLAIKENNRKVRLIRAPISINRIQVIYTNSNESKENIISQAQLRNNVPLETKMIKCRKTSFTKDVLKRWKWHIETELSPINTPIHLSRASGGILAMLFNVKSMSPESAIAYKITLEEKHEKCSIPGLREWMEKGLIISESKTIEGYLLWSIVKILAENRDSCTHNNLDNLVIDFLENVSSDLHDRTSPLCNTLESFEELGGGYILSECFDLHSKPLDRAIILSFQRRECQELLEFDELMLSDLDWAFSAVIFGARSGWIGLPLELRGDKQFSDKIYDWMVSFCHNVEISSPISKTREF